MTPVILLSVPGLRKCDLANMPHLSALLVGGDRAELQPSFPAVTCPVQANMTTGVSPNEHGVVANGIYHRDRQEVEMWTSPNDCILRPQIWDRLHQKNPSLTSAVWFPLHSKGCGADYVCTPAPIHNADGTESMWCYTRPEGLYEELINPLGHFPLHHFWGPLAGIAGTAWIVASAILAAKQFRPDFFYIYLPHLDYAAQKHGPDSAEANAALGELDAEIGKLVAGFQAAYQPETPLWIVASEYAINPVDHVTYPNRLLREAGLLSVREESDGEHLDFRNSAAWALVDHQFSHVFVCDRDPATIAQVANLFARHDGIAQVLAGADLAAIHLNHSSSGDLVLVSEPNSWQAYYWWFDNARAPDFARTVDIHRKPGYDPVELFIEMPAKAIPLDATLVKGSHGVAEHSGQHPGNKRAVIATSSPSILPQSPVSDTDVAAIVLKLFGIEIA